MYSLLNSQSTVEHSCFEMTLRLNIVLFPGVFPDQFHPYTWTALQICDDDCHGPFSSFGFFFFFFPVSDLFVEIAQEDTSPTQTAAQGVTPVLLSSHWQMKVSTPELWWGPGHPWQLEPQPQVAWPWLKPWPGTLAGRAWGPWRCKHERASPAWGERCRQVGWAFFTLDWTSLVSDTSWVRKPSYSSFFIAIRQAVSILKKEHSPLSPVFQMCCHTSAKPLPSFCRTQCRNTSFIACECVGLK